MGFALLGYTMGHSHKRIMPFAYLRTRYPRNRPLHSYPFTEPFGAADECENRTYKHFYYCMVIWSLNDIYIEIRKHANDREVYKTIY